MSVSGQGILSSLRDDLPARYQLLFNVGVQNRDHGLRFITLWFAALHSHGNLLIDPYRSCSRDTAAGV